MNIFDKLKKKNEEKINTNSFLEKYKPSKNLKKPSEKVLDFGEKTLPKNLIDLWKNYGFGSYGDGIIKLINPVDYMQSLYNFLGGEDFNKIPFAMTILGNLFYYNKLENKIYYLDIHNRDNVNCDIDFKDFFEKFIINDGISKNILRKDIYKDLQKNIGNIKDDEIYFYVPALMLGGSPNIKKMKKGDAKIHHNILFQMGGVIK